MAVLLLASVTISPASASPPGPDPNVMLGDGSWTGTLFGYQEVTISGSPTIFIWNGEMTFDIIESVVEGIFTYDGAGAAFGNTATATSNAQGEGTVSGTAFQPQFEVGQGVFNINVAVPGLPPIELSIPVTAADSFPVPITITGATCSQAVGEWNDFVLSFYAGMDAQVSELQTAFNVVRTGPAGLNEEVAGLYQDIQALQETVIDTHMVDEALLQGLLDRAYNLTQEIKKDPNCAGFDSTTFLTPITQAILNLIEFALNPENSAFFSNHDLLVLVSNAFGVGALGSGSPNQEKSGELIEKYTQILHERLLTETDTEAPAGEERCKDIKTILTSALSIGASMVAKLAEDFYASLGCGG
jgi:hypothetical protein